MCFREIRRANLPESACVVSTAVQLLTGTRHPREFSFADLAGNYSLVINVATVNDASDENFGDIRKVRRMLVGTAGLAFVEREWELTAKIARSLCSLCPRSCKRRWSLVGSS